MFDAENSIIDLNYFKNVTIGINQTKTKGKKSHLNSIKMCILPTNVFLGGVSAHLQLNPTDLVSHLVAVKLP